MSQQPPTQYGPQSQFDQQPRTQQPPQQGGMPTSQQGGMPPAQQGEAPIGQQGGGQQAGGQQAAVPAAQPQTAGKLDDALTEHMRVALHDFGAAANAAEWCAEQCIDEGPEMAECLRLCRDVADVAALNERLIARDSAFGPDLVDVFVEAADACARECARHQHAHCQECAEVLSRAVRSAEAMLASLEAQPTGTGQASQGI